MGLEYDLWLVGRWFMMLGEGGTNLHVRRTQTSVTRVAGEVWSSLLCNGSGGFGVDGNGNVAESSWSGGEFRGRHASPVPFVWVRASLVLDPHLDCLLVVEGLDMFTPFFVVMRCNDASSHRYMDTLYVVCGLYLPGKMGMSSFSGLRSKHIAGDIFVVGSGVFQYGRIRDWNASILMALSFPILPPFDSFDSHFSSAVTVGERYGT